jgi:Periplasmic binding protein domain
MRIPTCDTRCEPSRKPDRDLRLAIIPKDGTQDYWKAVYRGAREAVISATGRITLSWNDPGSENDCVPQIEFIEKALAERVSGIVLGPINAVALVQAVHHAVRANVPVLIIDSALRSERTAGFVAAIISGQANWPPDTWAACSTDRAMSSYCALCGTPRAPKNGQKDLHMRCTNDFRQSSFRFLRKANAIRRSP